MIRKKINKIHNYLIANNERLSLEHRLVLASLLMGIFMGVSGTLGNLLLTQSFIASLVPLVLVIIAGILYYFARFKKTYITISIITAIVGILGISIIWIYNGGINGPNFMIAITYLIIGLIIVPKKVKYYIFTLFIFVNISVLLIQLYRPDLIVNYPNELSHWLDNLIGLLLSAIFVFLIVQFIQKYYNNEKQRAEESDRLKSSFLANMSHEIRTPMNAIIGFSNLLSEAETEEKRNEFIRIITSNGEYLLNIINDLIDISKIEAGIIIIENRECNINNILNEIQEIFKIKDRIKNKEIDLDIDKGLPDNKANILTDNGRLQQVIFNLMENAYKFTFKGKIILGYTLIQKKNIDYVKFFIKDTGGGIKKNNQKMIFERFMQEDSSTTRVVEGTGLGLTISKALVNVLGGDIWVESIPPQGSTFYFTIPYHRGGSPEKIIKSSDGEIHDLSNKTILVAEDNDDNYRMFEHILAKTKINIIRAVDGVEAIEICKKDNLVDLILMDIRMPNKNGYETTKEIKKFRTNLPIIAQTAYALSGDKEKALEAGCNYYLSKPIIPRLLIKMIYDCLVEKN